MLSCPSWAKQHYCRHWYSIVRRHGVGRPALLLRGKKVSAHRLSLRPCCSARPAALAAATASMNIQRSSPSTSVRQPISVDLPTVAVGHIKGAIPLRYQQRAIKTATGQTILQDLNTTVFDVSITADSSIALLSVQSANGPTSLLDADIGQVLVHRFLACARCKLWWMTPETGSRMQSIPPETQFLLLEMEEEKSYGIVLPLICDSFRGTLRPSRGRGKEDTLQLRMESGDSGVRAQHWQTSLLVAAGTDPYELVDRAVAAAAKLSGDALPRAEKQLPAALDLFGWCTWDAFYSTVSAAGLREGLRSLISAGLRPRFLIIDDGWQLTDQPTFDGTSLPEVVQQSEATVLAEAAHQFPQGSTAGTTMPTLGGVGPVPHHPHELRSLDSTTSLSTADGVTANSREGGEGEGRELQPLMGQQGVSPSPGPGGLSPQPTDEPVGVLTWLVQQIAGWMMGIGTAAVLLFYQLVVDPAPPNSLPVRLFASAAKGFLRQPLLAFFSTASDFTRRLVSVRANAKFSDINAGPDTEWQAKPARLGDVVNHVKKEFGLNFVYCWHGLPAYWGGVMPGSELGVKNNARVVYPQPTAGLLEIEPSIAWNPAVLGGVGVVDEPETLFQDMHHYLSGSGIDGVKVDCQAGVGLVGSVLGGGPALSRRFHAALEDSVRRHFPGNHLINCMCHSTENLYRMTWSAVARASDDFFPRDAASSTPHISSCAYNSVFLGALVQPDWDMFHSRHPASRLHAIARAVSGGPVYVSDRPGEHDVELLKQLVLPDGSVLRASLPGRPTRDTLFRDVLRDGKTALKVWNMNGVGGVVGAFHLQGASWDRRRRRFHMHDKTPPKLTTAIRPADVEPFNLPPALDSSGTEPLYAVYVNSRDHLGVLPATGSVQVELEGGQADVVAITPVQLSRGVSFAPLGLCRMYNATGAVLHCSSTITTEGAAGEGRQERVVFSVDVRGCGEFLAYCSQQPQEVLVDGQPLASVMEGHRLTVQVPETSGLQTVVQFVFNPAA